MRYWVHIRLTTDPVDPGPDHDRMNQRIVEALEDAKYRVEHHPDMEISAVYATPALPYRVDETTMASAWDDLQSLRLTALGLRRSRRLMSRGGREMTRKMHQADELGRNFTVLSNLPAIVDRHNRVLCIPHLGYFNQRILNRKIPQGLNLVVNVMPHVRAANQTGVAANPLTHKNARFRLGALEDLNDMTR